jgi:dihydrofolate synthase/folylpolyglutamate synthase
MSEDRPQSDDEHLELEDLEYRAAAEAAYQELLDRIGEAQPQPRLEPTRKAAELLGDPHRAYPVIHITGTNGKTSISRMIESILRAYGLRTGLLTSPHLTRVNERIVIDGRPISNRAFAENWDEVRPYVGIVDAELIEAGEEPLTFFEALTVLAFASFADAPVDVAVLEVGMGGEWDSTNVADGQVAVFSPIALDHVQRLGSTIAQIARTKSGIIKPLAAVVSAQQVPEAVAELEHAAELSEATLALEPTAFELVRSSVAVGGQLVSIRGIAGRYDDIFLPLLGDHQGHNAALAVAAVEKFLGNGTQPLDPGLLAEGLGTVTSPGRLQLIGIEPTVLVDAAHNPHGAHALAEALRTYFDFDQITFVVGVLGDKDARGMLEELAPLAERIHATQSGSDRAIPHHELAELVLEATHEDATYEYDSLADALDAAREWAAQAPRRAVVVTGSITLVGDAIALAAAEGWK